MIVKELYERFPEFEATSNHFFDEFDSSVLSSFGLYLCDLLLIKEEGSVQEDKQNYFTETPIDWEAVSVDALIERCFRFIDELYLRNNVYINDLIFSCVYWLLADSPYSDKFAKKYFSK